VVKAVAAVACAGVIAPVSAHGQVPIPPLLPPPGEPAPEPPPPQPGPVSTAPGSVAVGVDVAHSGSLPSDALVPPLVRRWSVRTPAAGLLAADGRVYAVAGRSLEAYDQATGRKLWATPPSGFGAGAAYDAGLVFVNAGDDIEAYRADTGALAWRQHLQEVAFAGAPVATGGAVYIGYGQGGGRMLAFRANDGQPLWSVNTVDGFDAPAVDDHHVYVAGACANVAALDRASGQQVWLRRTGCSGGGSVTPALSGDRLWVPELDYQPSGDSDPPILNTADGSLVSRFKGGRPVFQDGLAVLPGDGEVRAVDATSGKDVWRFAKSFSSPIGIGHDLYGIGGEDFDPRKLVALDSETGKSIWSVSLPAKIADRDQSAVLAAAPDLLLVAYAGRLTAYESSFRPAPHAIALGAAPHDVTAGRTYTLTGVLGTDLRGSRPQLSIAAADAPRGRFGRVARIRPARDGGFATGARSLRNARWRVSAAGVRSNTETVYVYPAVRLGRPRAVGRRHARVAVKVAAPKSRLAGHRLVLYLQRAPGRPLVRLGSGRLAGARGHARATVVYRLPGRVGSKALLWHCVRGQLRLHLGRPSPLTRRCGARKLRRP
jgi:outer membrane protein assembly factor BamB